MKKKIALLTILGIFACLTSFGTSYAYLTAYNESVNEFTVGATLVEVQEEFAAPKELKPGMTFKKKPSVYNSGNLPCYVRIRADFSTSKAQEFCTLDMNTTDWELSTDGYYYYKELLEPEQSTPPLFTTVSISSSCSADDLIGFDIYVYSEAVQHPDHEGDHPADEYMTVWDDYLKPLV